MLEENALSCHHRLGYNNDRLVHLSITESLKWAFSNFETV